jgi:hypothetical protein
VTFPIRFISFIGYRCAALLDRYTVAPVDRWRQARVKTADTSPGLAVARVSTVPEDGDGPERADSTQGLQMEKQCSNHKLARALCFPKFARQLAATDDELRKAGTGGSGRHIGVSQACGRISCTAAAGGMVRDLK